MSDWLSNFESVGDNCEFGFVQRALGFEESSLLRWVMLDSVPATAMGIRSSFEGVFKFENLRPAGAGTMVRDITAGVAFHTEMKSVQEGEEWVFVASETERREIHLREHMKLDHLRRKFDRNIAGSERIYVAKRNHGLSESDAEVLLEAIADRGGGHLLYVTEAAEPHQIGNIKLIQPRMVHGWIDHFAPYSQANNVSLVHWEALLRATHLAFAEVERSSPSSSKRKLHKLYHWFPSLYSFGQKTLVRPEGGTTAKITATSPRPNLNTGSARRLTDEERAIVNGLLSPVLDTVAGKSHSTPRTDEDLLLLISDNALLSSFTLFDPVVYEKRFRDSNGRFIGGDQATVLHWLDNGRALRIVPTLLFDEINYCATYRDVADEGGFGFIHYITNGMKEGRAPTIWYDQAWYASQSDSGPHEFYAHFIARGVREGRFPSAAAKHIVETIAPSSSFSLDVYKDLIAASEHWNGRITPSSLDLLTFLFVAEWHAPAATPLEAFLTYLRVGVMEGKSPGPLFDPVVYQRRAVSANLPRRASDESPLMHWLTYGQAARIVPTERFDEAFYRASNPDISETDLWGFAHFIRYGVLESRLPNSQPRFRRRQSALSIGAQEMPSLYRLWYASDFPDRVHGSASEIPAAAEERLAQVLSSVQLKKTFAQVQAIEPEVGELSSISEFLLLPFYVSLASAHAEVRRRIPETQYDTVICVPWIRTGGADLVAGLLAKALLRIRPLERVLILRTDYSNFDRANWLPKEADVVDISDIVANEESNQAQHLLRVIFRGISARRVFNVNSRLCWMTFQSHGANLNATLNTYAYLFCWDQTPSGRRVGYPSEFFPGTASTMTAFLTDTVFLRDELAKMYRLSAPMRDRVVPMFTPAQTVCRMPSVAREALDQVDPASRRLVLWGGRLDRQKRFELVREIASRMPEVDFFCWGAALLDSSPDLANLPGNIVMKGNFDSFDDLPLSSAGAWLFTAAWEGMPTTIIELAVRGVVIVASAVGGVPELIQPATGWPVPEDATAEEYVATLRDALGAPEEAMRRAEELQRRVSAIYTEPVYDAALSTLLEKENTARDH